MAAQENGVLQHGRASSDSFDGAFVLDSVRSFYSSGLTRSLEWRERQLHGILKMLRDRQEEMVTALAADLHRNREDALMEVSTVRDSVPFSSAPKVSSAVRAL